MHDYTCIPRAPRRDRIALVATLTLLLGLALGTQREAHADNVRRLAHTLKTSDHAKARIAAAVSLGRLKSDRALAPLVRALRDPHPSVRAIAAAALGHLGDPKALPALKRATRDRAKIVRKRATAAVAAIRNELKKRRSRSTHRGKAGSAGFAGFDRSAAAQTAPTMYLSLQSTNDESSGRVHRKIRKARAQRLRRWMLKQLGNTPQVTLSKRRAGEHDLDRYNIDVTIVDFDARVRGPYVEIECKLRVAISNERGKMLSFLTGGAKVQVPKRSYRRKYLYRLQLEALQNSVKSVHQDVINHLAQLSHT